MTIDFEHFNGVFFAAINGMETALLELDGPVPDAGLLADAAIVPPATSNGHRSGDEAIVALRQQAGGWGGPGPDWEG
jgi:hypothetical protein